MVIAIKQQVLVLYVVAVIIMASSVLWLFVALTQPTEDESHARQTRPVKPQPSAISDHPVIAFENFEPLWSKRLQGKPPAPPVKQTQTKPPQATAPLAPVITLPKMTLTAIFHSQSHALATFNIQGQSVVCSVGEEVAGARVEKIEPDHVTLVYQKKTFVRGLEQ